MKSKKNKPLFCLVSSKYGLMAADQEAHNLNDLDDDNWCGHVLLASSDRQEICKAANTDDYGDNCIVADFEGKIYWKWYQDNGKWNSQIKNK